MLSFLRRILPKPLKRALIWLSMTRIGSFLLHLMLSGDRYECTICKKKSRWFLPSGVDAEIFRQLKVPGNGPRANDACPYCASLGRHRFIYIMLTKIIPQHKWKLLHFAPERGLEKILRSNPKVDYMSADIQKGRAMCVADITTLPFKDDSFDCIICSQVIEHIPDDMKALSEINRVLKTGGKCFLSTPICMNNEETIEYDWVRTDEERLKYYGQEDHVRLYGLDFSKRLQVSGFSVETYCAREMLISGDVERYCIVPDEFLYVATK